MFQAVALLCFSIKDAHIGDTHFSQHISKGLVIFVRPDKDKGRAIRDLGSKGQHEEALAFSVGIDQSRHRRHVDHAIKDEGQDESVGKPWTDATAGEVLWSGTVKIANPSQHVHRCPSIHGKGDTDQPLLTRMQMKSTFLHVQT